jgi:hypothetical protein
VNWDLWVHLFRGEPTLSPRARRGRVKQFAGGLTLVLQDTRKELYLSCIMMYNNTEWEKGWFYLRNDDADLP